VFRVDKSSQSMHLMKSFKATELSNKDHDLNGDIRDIQEVQFSNGNVSQRGQFNFLVVTTEGI